jgi:zinc-ribbon domain
MVGCPACGEENPDHARFCLVCGATIEPSVVREERKIVSVLFADLVGFTERAERMDPEDVRALRGQYFERVRFEATKESRSSEYVDSMATPFP